MMGYLKGGAFLIQKTEAKEIFIRSEFGEDQKNDVERNRRF